MSCPHCQHLSLQSHQLSLVPGDSPTSDVLFEICQACGLIWLDFGKSRPGLYRSVEAQVARWEEQRLHAEAREVG